MTSQQKVIVIAGAAGAYWLLTQKKTGKAATTKNPLTSALSKLLPARGTNTPYIASTNAATRNGTATQPRVPSSGLGFPPGRAGAGQAPTTTAGAAISTIGGLLSSILRRAGSSPSPAAAQRQAGSSGGSSGGASGGGSSSGAGGRVSSPMGGSAGVAGQQYDNGYFDSAGQWHGYNGYYDENGQFVPTDDNGNPFDPSGGYSSSGYFDDQGNWIDATGDAFVGPTQDDTGFVAGGSGFFDESGTWIPAGGAVDENGIWDPNEDPGVEFTGPIDEPSFSPGGDQFVGPTLPNDGGDYYADAPLDSSQFGTGMIDPIGQDDPGLTGFDDGSASTFADDLGYYNSVGNSPDAGGGDGWDRTGTDWTDE